MCNCGCGGKCAGNTKTTRRALGDDFNYTSYKNPTGGGYYLADMNSDDIRRIAEEEAQASINAANISKLAQGDLSPVTDVAVRTVKRVCTTAVTEEIKPYIPIGIGILIGAFFLGRATA